MHIGTLLNLTAEPTGVLYSWLPHDLEADRVVFFPDACPAKAPLPTGTAVRTKQSDWRRLAISDCGCGMRLVRADRSANELSREDWNDVAAVLKENKGGLGDLGGGNHFVDALKPRSADGLYLLIHTGSRHESGHVDDLIGQPRAFDREFERVVTWAARNRATIQELSEEVLGPLDLILDLPHNTYEQQADGSVIIRKGAAKVNSGDRNIIPAHIMDDVALVEVNEGVEETLFSLSHGTGRSMPTSEAERMATIYDFDQLRSEVLIPDSVSNASLRGEGPYAYRDLDNCLELIDAYIEMVERFEVIGYMGHL